MCACLALFSGTAVAEDIQIATAVVIESEQEIEKGTVIIFDPSTETYRVSEGFNDAHVYGVSVSSPAPFFTSDEAEHLVAASGIGMIRADASNGGIRRGDLLVTSSIRGSAARADSENDHVFAIALEDVSDEQLTPVLIQAEIGASQAKEMHAAKSGEGEYISLPRKALAIALGVGGLFFLLFIFRSAVANSVLSIGRNPRARSSIMMLTAWNIFFILVLLAIVVFAALAVLVLPV